ncbi:MAG: hypothetical protein IKN51_08100, partial [Bacteroidaceae bacterium]|nr:hypothetical protein [Bacteroidaceae bacterium]
MKKIYSLIALIALFVASVGVSAQKYHLVQKATTVETGVTYVLYCATAADNPYANSNPDKNLGGLGATLADDYYLWQFEATGEKSDDGYDLYVLKSVYRDAYWQEEDFEGNPGLDGYDMHNYAGLNANMGAKETAMRMVIVESGSTDDWRSTASTSDGFVISRNKPADQGEGVEPYYFKLSFQNHNLGFSPWATEMYSWQLWTVEENGEKEKLQELVDRIVNADITYQSGNDPGMYAVAAVETYNAALDAANTGLTQSLSDAEYTKLFEDLLAAEEALSDAINPIKAGYYFFVNGTPGFLEQQGVEKGLYASNATTPYWGDFVLEDMKANKDYSFLWQIIPSGDQWQLKNVLYGTIYNGPNTNALSQQCFLAANGTRKVYFEFLGKSQWQVKDNFSDKGLHANYHGGGSGKSSNIVTWNTGADNASAWYIRTADQEFVDAAIAYAAQLELIASVEPLCVEANTLYDNLFVISGDFTKPLITKADDTKAPGEGGNQFVCNVPEAVEGRYAALIDFITVATYNSDGEDTGSPTNYDENGEQAFFHSKYSQQKWPDAHEAQTPPYLMVDISENPASEFVLHTARRYNNANGFPTQIGVYVSNDTTGYSTATDKWTKVETINNPVVAAGDYFTSNLIQLGGTYKYLRFDMEKTNGNTSYFTLGEFNIFPGAIDEDLSQYHYVEGMKDAADAMKAQITAARQAVAEGTVTQQTIDDLKAAIQAVKDLYATPDVLLAAIDKAEKEIAAAVVGNDFGNVKTQASITGYQATLDAAKRINLEGKLIKEVIDNAIADLEIARNIMLEDMVVPEADKWYYIVNNYSDEAAYCLDGTMYVNVAAGTANVCWLKNTEGVLAQNATAMWRFVPVEGAAPHVFYLQNLATGLYMGNESGNRYSVTTTTSVEPIPFQLDFAGGDNTYIVSQKDNSAKVGLHAAAAGSAVVGWLTNALASCWTFEEVDPEIEGVIIPVQENATNVQVLPFAVAGLSDYNEGVSFYAVKNMTKDDSGITTVELYEKDTFNAGEAFVVVAGVEVADFVVAMPEEIDATVTPANGLVGVFRNTTIPAGKGLFVNVAATEEADATVELTASADDAIVPSLRGYVDPTKFTEAVDAETALTFTAAGLDWTAAVQGDVNGDGEVNTSDVVAVYNFIIDGTGVTKEAADVNGDGDVNSTDVVAIYNLIISGNISGESAGSKSFYPMADGDDTE